MRRLINQFAALGLLCSLLPIPATAHDPNTLPDLVAVAMPGVVGISVTRPKKSEKPKPKKPAKKPAGNDAFQKFFDNFGARNSGNGVSLGTGIVVDIGGLIVTTHSVVKDAVRIEVVLANGEKLTATLAGKDAKTDLALLKISPKTPLTALTFGNSDLLRLGQTVVAIGNPYGLQGSVSSGIISGLNRNLSIGRYDSYIQTDTAINRGNAGGPLLNLAGEVIGINATILSPSGGFSGIAYAIPANTAKNIASQLGQFGETRRGWLGVRIQAVTKEIAETIGLDKPNGALVAEVVAGSPSDDGGIKAGDLILTFDGKPIPTMPALPAIVANTEIGRTVDVEVIRKGNPVTLKITLGRLPENNSVPPATKLVARPAIDYGALIGVTVAPLTPQNYKKYKIAKKVRGVVVASVERKSGAAQRGVRIGDVIAEIGQEATNTVDQFNTAMAAQSAEGRSSILLLVSTQKGDVRFVAVRMKKPPAPSPATSNPSATTPAAGTDDESLDRLKKGLEKLD